MSRLEDWQLDMLQAMTFPGASVTVPDGYTGIKPVSEGYAISVPLSWLRPLLEEVRASRASTGGGAEPKGVAGKVIDKLNKLWQANLDLGDEAHNKNQQAYYAKADSYKNAVRILEEAFSDGKV